MGKSIFKEIGSKFGAVVIEEFDDHFRVSFNDHRTFFISILGDLLQVFFNAPVIYNTKTDLEYVIWMLSSPEFRTLVNPKFGNNPELIFSAAQYAIDAHGGRSCVVLPTDTVETAIGRLNNVWYKQAPVPNLSGDFVSRVEG